MKARHLREKGHDKGGEEGKGKPLPLPVAQPAGEPRNHIVTDKDGHGKEGNDLNDHEQNVGEVDGAALSQPQEY